MTAAAIAVRESLSVDDLESATYAFDDDERYDLRLAPLLLEGLTLRDMGEESSAKVGDLVEASLGPVGRKKADDIRGLEDEVVRMEEKDVWYMALFASLAGIRGTDLYYLSLYGDPSGEDPWGYRFDGHHLSLNFTVVDGAVSPTPLFFGGQPREVPPGGIGPAGLRVLAKEEDTARALYLSLDAQQRERATLPLELNRDLFVGGGERVDPNLPPVGIPGDALTPDQKRLLNALLEAYFENVSTRIASSERARIDAAGRESLHFAWAGFHYAGRGDLLSTAGPDPADRVRQHRR